MELSLVLDIQNGEFGNNNIPILSNVNFSLAIGEMCYLIGPSGSGKSTLFKTLYGSLPVISGKVKLVGQDLSQLTRKEIPDFRRKIGMVFQDFHLFYKWTVGRNLDYILRATDWTSEDDRKTRISEVLNEVGLLHKIEDEAHTLSGGEQQKLVIARAILNSPSIIIADEPTGNLDPQSSSSIMELLYKVAAKNKMAILVATHDYKLIEEYPARIFTCDQGTITEKI